MAETKNVSQATRTYGELRQAILDLLGAASHFELFHILFDSRDLWDRIDAEEYDRGFDRTTYYLPQTPPLADMSLLTQDEFDAWMGYVEEMRH